MIRRSHLWVCLTLVSVLAVALSAADEGLGWESLFDGKTPDGWKASENPDSFKVVDGAIVADGPRSQLYYVGPIENALFKDFELKVDVRTEPGANGGIYFQTQYQETGWPTKGFEAQVNNTNLHPSKTGSLFAVRDIAESPVKDGQWFTEHIIVQGKHIVIKVDGKVTVDWTEPEKPQPPAAYPGRVIAPGTVGLQCHDPAGKVFYKNIRIKPLPVIDWPLEDLHVHLKGGLTLKEAVAISKRRGVKFGIAQNCGKGFPCTNDEQLEAYLKSLDGAPVYKAMQAEGREWLTMFSRKAMAKADYIFTDSMTWTDDKGRRMRLWMPDEVFVDDEQQFMDMLVDRAVGILNNEPIDIYVNPTYLPAVIADKYDQLWTRQRMMRVIKAAKRHQVAIEINSRFKLPSETFIKLAKQQGVKFTCGTNNSDKDLGSLEYSKRMIRVCGLTRDDFFTPQPPGKRAVDRWKPRH